MKSVKLIFALLLVALIAVLGFFMYQAIVNGRNVPAEVRNSPEYTIALRSAERIRFFELPVGAFLFPMSAFALALARFPRTSWLRNFLAAAAIFLVIFAAFAKYMESDFQITFPTSPLPPEALQVSGEFALSGILGAAVIFFITERIHAWRVAK